MHELPLMTVDDMCEAVKCSNLKKMHGLLKTHPQLLHYEVNFTVFGGWLHYATHYGAPGSIGALVEAGLDINGENRLGATPLAIAVSGYRLSVARELLKHGADPSKGSRFGKTVLHLAIEADNEDLVKDILDKRPEVDVPFIGNTPLMFAAVRGKTEIVKMLLKAGADPAFQHIDDGTCALDAAQAGNHQQTVEVLRAWTQAARAQRAIDSVDGAGLRPLEFKMPS